MYTQAEACKKEVEDRELHGVTFVPEITLLAKALWSGGDLNAQPAWQRLSVDKRAKTMEAILAMKQQREEAEVCCCV